jgi:hypothetical protein
VNSGWNSGFWVDLASSSPSQDEYEKALVPVLQATGCAATGAPYLIRRFVKQYLPFIHDPYKAALATAFLDEANCAATLVLSEDDKLMLRDSRGPVARPPTAAAATGSGTPAQ